MLSCKGRKSYKKSCVTSKQRKAEPNDSNLLQRFGGSSFPVHFSEGINFESERRTEDESEGQNIYDMINSNPAARTKTIECFFSRLEKREKNTTDEEH